MEIRPILSTLMRHKTAATLIVLEIALTCAIICNALFMIGERITFVNETSGLAENELVRVQITGIGNDDNAAAQTLTDLAALRGLPGVTGATVINQVPFTNSSWNSGVRLSSDQVQSSMVATVYMADDQFMDTLGLRLVAGRWFQPDEFLEFETVDRAEGPVSIPGAVITRKMAERLFPGEDALGRNFYSWGEEPIRIVGVVEHLVRPSLQGGPEAREYSMIFPIRPTYAVGGNYVIRTSPERRDEILAAATNTLRASGPRRIVLEENTKTMQALREEFYQSARAMAWLLGIVCLGLLFITSLGIVGLASFWVQQRTKQIGVRRALGATRGQILRYFQTENFLLATIGIVLGMLAAYGINQLLMSKYELARLPLYYLPVGAFALWLLGQVAVFGPARRAAAVPPAIATRSV